MKTLFFTSALVVSVWVSSGCSSSRRTQRNAAVGAATGAVVGGVIGNQSGNPRTGAAVGGVASGAYSQQGGSRTSTDSSDYYMALLTSEEIETLRARARSSGNAQYPLPDYLTAQEKANLRNRDAARREEIGR